MDATTSTARINGAVAQRIRGDRRIFCCNGSFDGDIPAAKASVMIPAPGWKRVIDASTDNLARAASHAARQSNGCNSYQFYLLSAGWWLAGATPYVSCPL